MVLAVPPGKFSWTGAPYTSSVLALLYPLCCSRPISFLNTSGLCILSAHFCSYSYFSPMSLLNRNCCSHKNDRDRQKGLDCEERFSKPAPFSARIKPWTHRKPPEVLCCKHSVTFKRPPSESWEQSNGLLGESSVFATQGTDAIYNNSCCPQLGMKTISICPHPGGNCRTRDVVYVSVQCLLLQHGNSRVGREGLWRAQPGLGRCGAGERGWGKGMVPKGMGFPCKCLLLEIIQMVSL